MSLARIVLIYRLIFISLIVIASSQALVIAHEGLHHVPLASAELIGAFLLLWRRTQLIGAGLLLCVFAGTQVLLAAQGNWPTHLLQYAASTILIILLDRTAAERQR